jgi:hypothetical protein
MKASDLAGQLKGQNVSLSGQMACNFDGGHFRGGLPNLPLSIEMISDSKHLKGKLVFNFAGQPPPPENWEFDAVYLGNTIGKWQGVQGGTPEQLDLRRDRTLVIKDAMGREQNGVYSWQNGAKGKILAYNLVGAQDRLFLTLGMLEDSIMVLQEPNDRHRVYRQFMNGPVPKPNDVQACKNLILGKWKADEKVSTGSLEFKEGGTMAATGPKNLQMPLGEQKTFSGVYQIADGVLELSQTLPNGGFGTLKATIISVTAEELSLLNQANNVLLRYRRVK